MALDLAACSHKIHFFSGEHTAIRALFRAIDHVASKCRTHLDPPAVCRICPNDAVQPDLSLAGNTRTDSYGGQTAETRTRLLLEVVDAATAEFGAGRVGVRLSPFGKYNSMPSDLHVEETVMYLCDALSQREVAYLHLVYQLMPSGNMDDSAFNERTLSDAFVGEIRRRFHGALIWCGGFDAIDAQAALDSGKIDFIAFGRPFVSNPDLVDRLKNGWPLSAVDPSTFYTRNGEKGYTDFPTFAPSP